MTGIFTRQIKALLAATTGLPSARRRYPALGTPLIKMRHQMFPPFVGGNRKEIGYTRYQHPPVVRHVCTFPSKRFLSRARHRLPNQTRQCDVRQSWPHHYHNPFHAKIIPIHFVHSTSA
ncbi:MAG: hypothetical protein HUU08_12960 [Candidatus Brocadia sp.]|nr:hypothetical protein [Candidatus Brocadia sp.]